MFKSVNFIFVLFATFILIQASESSIDEFEEFLNKSQKCIEGVKKIIKELYAGEISKETAADILKGYEFMLNTDIFKVLEHPNMRDNLTVSESSKDRLLRVMGCAQNLTRILTDQAEKILERKLEDLVDGSGSLDGAEVCEEN